MNCPDCAEKTEGTEAGEWCWKCNTVWSPLAPPRKQAVDFAERAEERNR